MNTANKRQQTAATLEAAAPPTDLANWISLAECAARLPSVQPGKRTASITVLRLARKHGLEILRRGPYRFVFWPAVVATFKPERSQRVDPPVKKGGARRTLGQQKSLRERMKEVGLA